MNPEKISMDNNIERNLGEKEQRWQEKLRKLDQVTDKLGLGIDEGIKETVAAFQVFEINTIASHEGKIDRIPTPYIDIESPDIKELDDKLDALEENSIYETSKAETIRTEILKKNLEERKKIIPLLEEFYAERKAPYEIRLNIRPLARGWSRIQSQGADFQEIEEDEKTKKQRLIEFQSEMKAFTEFLKEKYFTA